MGGVAAADPTGELGLFLGSPFLRGGGACSGPLMDGGGVVTSHGLQSWWPNGGGTFSGHRLLLRRGG
jgi:hypothetical protein